jgi:hypothetical protein
VLIRPICSSPSNTTSCRVRLMATSRAPPVSFRSQRSSRIRSIGSNCATVGNIPVWRSGPGGDKLHRAHRRSRARGIGCQPPTDGEPIETRRTKDWLILRRRHLTSRPLRNTFNTPQGIRAPAQVQRHSPPALRMRPETIVMSGIKSCQPAPRPFCRFLVSSLNSRFGSPPPLGEFLGLFLRQPSS